MLSGVQRFSHQTQREVEEKKKRNDHFGLCTKPKHNVVMHEECEKITRDYLKTYIVYVCMLSPTKRVGSDYQAD